MNTGETHLSISEVAQLTHLSESTLRMWERRYGFPNAVRGAGGHRRYSMRDVERIHAVLALRMEGLQLRTAIERVIREDPARRVTVSGHLRTEGAATETLDALWPLRIALTAIVDEVALRGEDAVVVAAVNAGVPVDELRARCETLSRTARLIALFSEHEESVAAGLPAVVHVQGSPRETIGCDELLLVDRSSCAVAIAVHEESAGPNGDGSTWSMQWTAKPGLVRSTMRVALDAVAPHSPALVTPAIDLLGEEAPPLAPTSDGLLAAGTRMLRYLARAERGRSGVSR